MTIIQKYVFKKVVKILPDEFSINLLDSFSDKIVELRKQGFSAFQTAAIELAWRLDIDISKITKDCHYKKIIALISDELNNRPKETSDEKVKVVKLYARYVHPSNGYDYDKDLAAQCLIQGNRYQVKTIDIYSWNTTITLAEVDGLFNSVLFEFEDENGENVNIMDLPEIFNDTVKLKLQYRKLDS